MEDVGGLACEGTMTALACCNAAGSYSSLVEGSCNNGTCMSDRPCAVAPVGKREAFAKGFLIETVIMAAAVTDIAMVEGMTDPQSAELDP